MDLEDAYKAKGAEVKDLVAKKEAIDKEIINTTDYLTVGAGSKFGLHGSLVDQSGFPDKDVESILAVRHARNQLAKLKNDYRTIMDTIQLELQNLHGLAAQRKIVSAGSTEPSSEKENSSNSSQPIKPIALIDQVYDNSPAQEAGAQVGDSIISFGTVGPQSASDPSALSSIAHVVKDSKNSLVNVVVLRDNKHITLKLVPRRWAGNGLLGCHLTPL